MSIMKELEKFIHIACDPEVIKIGFLGYQDMNATSFVSFLKKKGRFSKYTIEYAYNGKDYKVRNENGHYTITVDGMMYKFPYISRAAILNPEIGELEEDYLRIIFGERAPQGFWKNLDRKELNQLIKFGLLYVCDVSSFEVATRVRTSDVLMLRIPPKNRVGIRIFDMIKLLYPEMQPWDIRTPDHAFDDKDVVKDCVRYIEDYFNSPIQSLSRIQIMEVAPNLLNKYTKKNLVELMKEE